jgi:hypothetical protein
MFLQHGQTTGPDLQKLRDPLLKLLPALAELDRRVRGKKAWQLLPLPEHGEALDRFEKHLEVSVSVSPVSARRELD